MNTIEKAVVFAAKAHAGQVRKGTDRPYILHLIETLMIVRRFTYHNEEELFAAAVLHDILEDTSVTLKRLEKEFGPRIAGLVASVSEDKMKKMPPEATWRARKWKTIFRLRTADHDTKIIVLADCLSNLRELTKDYDEIGDEIWERFNQKDPAMHLWYYEEIYEILAEERIFDDSDELLELGDMIDNLRYKIKRNRIDREGWF